MINKIKDYIKKNNLINTGDHIVIGVSGGADSICLLSVLNELYRNEVTLHVVHIHHGIRKSADGDEQYVKTFCEKLDIDCTVHHFNVLEYATNNGMSTEEAGRVLRYNAFYEKLNMIEADASHKKIAVAHNMNDNAETMLLNIFRGSSIAGVIGIRPKREDIIRPLLCVSRNEIEKYLSDNDIEFCHDETNESDDYARNRIRHKILPVASEEINSGAINNMFRMSEDIQEIKEYLDSEINKTYTACVTEDDNELRLSTSLLCDCHDYIIKSVIYKAFGKISGSLKDVENQHIKLIYDLLNNQTGKCINLPYGVTARKSYDEIIFSKGKKAPKNNETTSLVINGQQIYDNYKIVTRCFDYDVSVGFPKEKYTKWFDYDKITNGLLIRTKCDDDYIVIDKNGSIKKLGRLFIDEKIPADTRDNMPLIADGNEIIWVLGHRSGCSHLIDKNTRVALEIKITEV